MNLYLNFGHDLMMGLSAQSPASRSLAKDSRFGEGRLLESGYCQI